MAPVWGRRAEEGPAEGPRPLDRWGLRVRLLVSGGLVVLVCLGTLVGGDHWWPFSPMSQYAFSVRNDGVINSFVMEALREDGTTSQVALSKEGIGLERSEMEGQLPRFERAPALMQTVAVLQARRQPDASPLVEIYLRNKQTELTGDRRKRVLTLATWRVLHPDDPQRGLDELRRSDDWPPQ